MKYTNIMTATEEEQEEINELAALAGLEMATGWGPNILAYHGLEKRSILICGEITEDVANAVCSQLKALHAEDEEAPIYVYVNTVGGDVPSALAIYDWMTCLPMPVIGFTYGRCSSAGLPILMGADIRLATPNCRFFYHEVVHLAQAVSQKEAEENAESYKWFNAKITEILKKRAKIKAATWRKYFNGQTSFNFDSEFAKEAGIIHDILEPVKKKVKFNG